MNDDTAAPAAAAAPADVNPAFTVEIAVAAAYRFDPLKPGEKPAPGAVVVETASGPCVRNLLSFEDAKHEDGSHKGYTVTKIGFGMDSITSIMRDRAAANLPKKSMTAIVAEHIQDAAMRDHSPREHWIAVRCAQNPTMGAFLKGYFELSQDWPKEPAMDAAAAPAA